MRNTACIVLLLAGSPSFAAVLAGCGAATPASRDDVGPPVEQQSDTDSVVAPQADESVEHTDAAPSDDLLRCELELRTFKIGPTGEEVIPTDPAAVDGGILVAYFNAVKGAGPGRVRLSTQRLDATGQLAPPVTQIETDDYWRFQHLVGDGQRAWLVTGRNGGELRPLDRAGQQAGALLSLMPDAHPQGATAGPRGPVFWQLSRKNQITLISYPGGPNERHVELAPRREGRRIPVDAGLASGAAADALLHSRELGPRRHRLELAVVNAGATVVTASHELDSGPGAFETALAAGPHGFGAVWTSSDLHRLTFRAIDEQGTPSHEPVVLCDGGDSGVCRYPRVASLGDGWAVTWWDGVGPVLRRLAADGQPTGPAQEVRTGEEIGGHTDAPVVTVDGGLVVQWRLGPRMSGTFRGMIDHTETRLGLLRCRQ